MHNYREHTVIAVYKRDCHLTIDQEIIVIRDIQPLEIKLFQAHVEYFISKPERIFVQEHPMTLIFAEHMPFEYFLQNGNHRVYALHKLGVKELIIECVKEEEWLDDFELLLESAMESFNEGVKSWDKMMVYADSELLEIFAREQEK